MALNVKKIYETMANSDERTQALDDAEDIAKLCYPTLAPKGVPIKERPSTNAGIQATRSLGSSLSKASVPPPGTKAFRLDILPAGWDHIRQNYGEEGVAAFRKKLDDRERAMTNSLAMKTAKGRLSTSIRRNLCEGTTGFCNRFDRLDVYPLRSLAVERESGIARILALHEEITPDPVTEGDEKQTKKDVIVNKYTLVNFETGEIHVQEDKGASRRVDTGVKKLRKRKSDDENPPEILDVRQFFVAVGEVPDVGDYPLGYAANYKPQFLTLDNLDASINEATSIASWNLLRLKPGSAVALDPAALKRRRSGDPIVADKDDIAWVAIEAKLADFAFLVNLRPALMQQIEIAFAMGIKDRLTSGNTTATEVLQIIDELNTLTQDLLSSLEQTLLQPLLESEFYLQDLTNPLFAGFPPEVTEKIVKVIVLTGANALEQERQEKALILQVAPALKAMDPFLVIDGEVAFKAITARMPIGSLPGLVRRMTPDEIAVMAAQAGGGEQSGGGAEPAKGQRTQTIMTRGGPQPPQPKQGAPPVGPRIAA